MNCVLCGRPNLDRQATVLRSDLIWLYKRTLEIDITRLIQTDLSILRCKDCDLIFFDPQVTGDELFYNDLQKRDQYYQDDRPEFDWATSKIPSGASVLEVGAGNGAFALHVPQNRYTGLDLSAAAKTMAAARGVTINTVPIEVWADENREAYDVVCHFQVLEHVSQPGRFLQACSKALKPGGMMLATVPAEDSFLSIVGNFALNMPPHHISRWTDKAVTAAAKIIHCKVDEIEHDAVAPVHRLWMVSEVLRHQWFGDFPPIDLRFSTRLKIAAVRRLVSLLRLDAVDQRFPGNGHTVKVAYSKP